MKRFLIVVVATFTLAICGGCHSAFRLDTGVLFPKLQTHHGISVHNGISIEGQHGVHTNHP